MIENGNQPPFAATSPGFRLAARFKLFSGLVLLFWCIAAAGAERPEEAYLKIYGVIDQADSLSEKGQTNSAKAKYQEAQTALLNLKKENPAWNTKVVTFRLNYLSGRISALSPQAPAQVATETTPAVTTETTPAAKPPAPLPAGMSLKLLTAGNAPRQVLRMRATPGVKETGTLVAKSSMGMGGAGTPIEMMKLPAMKMTLGVLPKNITDEGDINYDVIIEEVDVVTEADTMPGTAEAMKTSLAGMKGLVVTCMMSDRGFSKSVEAKIPSGADAETRAGIEAMKESFAETDFVLPHEPIGPGARWELKQKIKADGMTIDQTTTCQLISMQGDILTVKSFSVQSAANQKVPNPMAPQTMADLLKMTGNLTNTSTIHLTKLLPPQETSDEYTETTVAMTTDGQRQTLTIKSVSNSRVEAK
jgi:hypothetical protein